MPSIFINDHQLPSRTKKQSQVLANNRLLPILRIYPDLLEYIFLLSVQPESSTPLQQRQRAAISCSQTCHDWRAIALSIKALWSGLVDFEANSEAWNEELLRRSWPSSIVVGTMAYAIRSRRVIAAEVRHLERMRVYRVGFEAGAWDVLVEGLQRPAPNLEYLNISYGVGDAADDAYVLPSTLFAGDAPRLRRLEMTQCLVDFKAPVLGSLTTLSVENLNALMAPTPLEWLANLERLPWLTTLRLINAMSSQPPFSTCKPAVNLSRLSALHVDASLHELSVFLTGLELPVNCGLMIGCNECYPGPELDVVLEAYVERLDYAHRVRYEECPFFIYAQKSTVSIWNEQPFYRSSASRCEAGPVPSLCLDLDVVGGCWEELMTPVLYALRESFSRFTSLQLQLSAIHPGLMPCLVRASRLTRLVNVSATMTKHLFSHIQQQHPTIALPVLDTIVFNDDESMWGAPYRVFVGFLRWRERVGRPVGKVLFRRCWVMEDTVVGLEMMGVEVECEMEGARWERL